MAKDLFYSPRASLFNLCIGQIIRNTARNLDKKPINLDTEDVVGAIYRKYPVSLHYVEVFRKATNIAKFLTTAVVDDCKTVYHLKMRQFERAVRRVPRKDKTYTKDVGLKTAVVRIRSIADDSGHFEIHIESSGPYVAPAFIFALLDTFFVDELGLTPIFPNLLEFWQDEDAIEPRLTYPSTEAVWAMKIIFTFRATNHVGSLDSRQYKVLDYDPITHPVAITYPEVINYATQVFLQIARTIQGADFNHDILQVEHDLVFNLKLLTETRSCPCEDYLTDNAECNGSYKFDSDFPILCYKV